METFIIYLVLLVTPSGGGTPVPVQEQFIVARFWSQASCETYGRDKAQELAKTFPQRVRVSSHCKPLSSTQSD